MIKSILAAIAIMCVVTAGASAKEYTLLSPDGKINATVEVGKELTWSVGYGNEPLLNASRIAMSVELQPCVFGVNPKVRSVSRQSIDKVSTAAVPTKSRIIHDHYNQLKLSFAGGYAVTFRLYNNGAAYRFETSLPQDSIRVGHEVVEFNLADDCQSYWPRETNPEFITHCEGFFDKVKVSTIAETKYAYLPIYLNTSKGTKMVIMDPDLFDYPNLFLFGSNGHTLRGEFPKAILESRLKPGSDRNEDMVRKANYIARTRGTRTYPWRLVTIDPDDRSLLENNLVYQLSTPAIMGDLSWIKPGKISWEWWNSLNVYGVDFKAGVNTATYKYFIDFASKYGIEYILLDEGWSVSTLNIKEPNASVDVQELVQYGKSKGVGIVLWTLWNPMKADLEGILDVYQKWGVKGIKIDFMQRSDQDMVNFYEAIARAAFERHILVDFHGSYKPSGVQRKYPNVMSFEGVYGMEHNKCSTDISPDHDLILPFTRMVAGPMDYTPGATINATKTDFAINWNHPMSQGTRAHQAALYVVFESPLQMLCDSPSSYYRAPEFTEFITKVPTVWDQTHAICAQAGEYLVIARRNANTWYIGAITSWKGRSLEISLDFLDNKAYSAQIFKDGVNANVYASDFKLETISVNRNSKLKVDMANGGGWAAIVTVNE